ncbi:MAG: hypothetical protein AB8B58_19275 [Roseobacter sp.]
MVRLIALALMVLAGSAYASEWRYGSFDNGSWFEAHVSHQGLEIAFNCGGRSPGGIALPQTDEPMITDDYFLNLTLAQPALGGSDGATFLPPRGDVVVAVGTTGYQLPRAVYDELNLSGWLQPIVMSDPLIAALLGAQAVAVDVNAQRLATYDGAGLGRALTRLIAFCDARWAATGVALPAAAVPLINDIRRQGVDITPTVDAQNGAAAAPPSQRTDAGLWAAVQAYIAGSCNGAVSQYHDGYAQAANLDGDGVQDYVIAWDSIECAGPMARPFCGASQCAVDVFASSSYAPGTRPKTVYAQSMAVVPGSNGRDLLQLAGRLANCRDPSAPPDCLFLWGWANGDLQRMN